VEKLSKSATRSLKVRGFTPRFTSLFKDLRHG
jgi:hypothetical protein